MFNCRWVAAISVMAAFTADQTVAQQSDFANVKIVVFDTFGNPIQSAAVKLSSVVPGEIFTATGGEVAFQQVPFGVYDLEVRVGGFLTRKERIGISQPSLVFRVGLQVGSTYSEPKPEIIGSVKSAVKGNQNLWVRLMAIYSSDFVEDAVDSSGKFELVGMAPGKYLLFVFQKDKLLATKPIEVLRGKQVIEMSLE